MGATERTKQYLEFKGISKYKFYQKTGFSNKFLDNSSNMGTDRACIILRYYDDLSPEWLITGKGEMLRKDQIIDANEIEMNDTTVNIILKRLEILAAENALLKNEIEQMNRQKPIKNIGRPDIAAESEMKNYKK